VKHKKVCVLAAVVLSLVVGVAKDAQASVGILYYYDYMFGPDGMAAALSSLGSNYSVTTVSDSSEFETEIATGNYSLGIFFVQGYDASVYTSAINALGSFVAGGGKAIYADWSMNSALASANFGVGFTGNFNENTMTVTMPELAAGLTNPVTITTTDPGWGIYSTGLNSGTTAATFANGETAIAVSMGGRVTVNGFLSDTIADEATAVRLFQNSIHTVLGDANAIPEPGSLIIWSLLGGFGVFLRRRAGVAARRR
jgi:hypothetical protein